MNVHRSLSALLIGLTSLIWGSVPAGAIGSIFSGIAPYGIFERFVSDRSAGMAEAGLALSDSVSLNALNPAALGYISKARISVGGFLSTNRMRDYQSTDFEDGAGFDHFGIAINLKKGLGLAFMLTPQSRLDYLYLWNVTIDNTMLTQSRKGSGGLSRAELNVGWAFSTWGSVGGGLNVKWGQVEENRVSYTSVSGYDPYIEFLNTKQWLAFGGSLGLLVQPLQPLILGAVFEPETPIKLTHEFAYSEGDSTVTTKEEYKLAALYGVGLSYRFTSRWLMTGQLLYNPWSQISSSDLPPTASEYQDAYEAAGGAEWSPGNWDANFLLARLYYRFGLRWETSYVKSQHHSIDSYFASFGLGYPLHQGRDRIDIAVEFGLRGDLNANGGQERLLKIHLGFNLGETWFARSKPPWEKD